VAFVRPLLKLLRRDHVLGSAPPGERRTGQAMPKTQKPSETVGEPTKKGPPAEKATASAKPPSKKPASQARPPTGAENATPPAAHKPAAKPGVSAKKPAGAVAASGSSAPAPPANAGSESAKKSAEHPTGKAPAGRSATPKFPVKAPAAQGSPPEGPADDDQPLADFLAEMRVLLREERAGYVRQADELKAEADSLALEHEPGDVQFDEEGGEGGTSNVDRELDLVLSAQARSAIMEIDRATIKIEAGTYGTCEQCGKPIPQARLKALPYAALCVACKSGGLSRR
jgi:DnaK suppressor protein